MNVVNGVMRINEASRRPDRARRGGTPNLTVVIPTRNEEQNVAALLERAGPAVEPLGRERASLARKRLPAR